jgi:hypothetical protein
MGDLYTKVNGEWVISYPYMRLSANTGWRRGSELYRRGATDYALVHTYDTTHPNKPTLVDLSWNTSTRLVTLKIKMPSDADVTRSSVKYSSTGHPLYALDSTNMHNWNLKDVSPNQTVTYTFTPLYYNKLYYISAWAIDAVGNPSDRLRLQFTIPQPTSSPSPTPSIQQVTYNCGQSGSYNLTNGFWSSQLGSTVGQAGQYNHRGGWFYGGRITRALTNAKKIRRMTIKIQRVNSLHGVSAGANVYLTAHTLGTKGSGSDKPLSPVANPPKMVGTLTRGQTKTFTVPAEWYPSFISGKWVGLGLWYPSGATSYTSSNYILTHGVGTSSGQVFIEWEQ